MAIGAMGVSSSGHHIYMEYVCSWECADHNYHRRRIKPLFEDGYELKYPTLCSICGGVIPATEEVTAND